MSDETATADNTPANEAPDTTESVEKLKAEVEKWKALSRKNEDRAKENAEAAKAWAEHQETAKTEDEKRADEVEKLKKQLAQIEADSSAKVRAVLAEKVAATKGVPAKYLAGDTEEDLLASADEFLTDIEPLGAKRTPGVVPSSGTGDPKPQAASLDTGKARAEALLTGNSK